MNFRSTCEHERLFKAGVVVGVYGVGIAGKHGGVLTGSDLGECRGLPWKEQVCLLFPCRVSSIREQG